MKTIDIDQTTHAPKVSVIDAQPREVDIAK
jgi:hypothetical protein